MAEPDAIIINGAYMNVNEGKIYIGTYRNPQSYPMSSTSLLNVMYFLDIARFVLTTAILTNGGRESRKIPKMVCLKSLSHRTYIHIQQLFL